MKKVSKEEYMERVKARFPEEEFELVEYDSIGKPAILKCKQCDALLKPSTASNFLIKTKVYGCVKCHGLWKQREEDLNKIKEKYDILETYVKETHTYYIIRCKNCGHVRDTTLKNIVRHLDCGCVTNVFRGRSGEEFIKHVNRNNDGGYELISEYKDQTTKVLLRHTPCGFIWSVRPSDVVNGRSHCPKCGRQESYGASLITSLLTDAGIFYEKEKTLEGSRLRFDFYIEKGSLKIAIEYQGSQHYKEQNYFSASLEVQQERDNRKREYCIKNNIELIEIPYTYTQREIEQAILKIVSKLNDYPARE